MAGKELKPVYDTAVVFELWQYFPGSPSTDTTLGQYKVAKYIADKGIKFDTIETKILKGQDISKASYEFHWTKEKGKIATAIKNEDVFNKNQTFYTFYDGAPSAANHKKNISDSELFGTEWMKKDASTGKYKYLIFMTVPTFDKIVAYGESINSLEDAKALAQYIANLDYSNDPYTAFMEMSPYPNISNPVRYGATWNIEGKDNDEIYVYLSGATETFWMNDSGKIIAKHDANNNVSTDDMYKQQK